MKQEFLDIHSFPAVTQIIVMQCQTNPDKFPADAKISFVGQHSDYSVPHYKPSSYPTPLKATKYISDIDTILLDPSRYDPSTATGDDTLGLSKMDMTRTTPFEQTLPPHSPLLQPTNISAADSQSIPSFTLNVSSVTDSAASASSSTSRGGTDLMDVKIQMAGARKKLLFNPSKISCGIVTCGGVCPGLNNVVRSLVNVLYYRYGVRRILGFKYGFLGMVPGKVEPVNLTPEFVKDIHQFGGTILGTSRGPQDPKVMVDFLVSKDVDILFCIGGDGTQKGAHAIAQEIQKRNIVLSVVGIGKTIDNDLLYLDKSFGFETAVQLSQQAIITAHEEARSVQNGIGIVKLMGRESGAIALYASLASGDVNIVLIPEVKFEMEKIIDYLEERFKTRDHCLIVCAEGAGQNLVGESGKTDKSGNRVFNDIGEYLKENISKGLKARNIQHSLKYIDPSYSIRAGVANASDSILCTIYAQMAAHAALAGKTDIMVGMLHSKFVHLPLSRVTMGKKNVDTEGFYWQGFLDATGSPFC